MSDGRETVVIMPNSWGSGKHTAEAFKNALVNLPIHRIKDQETITIAIYTVKGDWEVTHQGAVRAEEFIDEEEGIPVKTEDLITLDKALSQIAIMIEELRIDEEISSETRKAMTELMR